MIILERPNLLWIFQKYKQAKWDTRFRNLTEDWDGLLKYKRKNLDSLYDKISNFKINEKITKNNQGGKINYLKVKSSLMAMNVSLHQQIASVYTRVSVKLSVTITLIRSLYPNCLLTTLSK